MRLPNINDATIRSHATEKSFQRGESYYRQNAVISLTQRDKKLIGKVEGSECEAYRVSIQFDGGGLTAVDCTCPYNFEGWCKHIVATLLETVHNPESIQQRSSLSELLQPLKRDQLQALLEGLAEEQPDIIEQIEWQLQQESIAAQPKASQANAAQPKARHTKVDPEPFRQQVKNILRYNSNDWDDSPALYEIRALIAKADDFTDKGDGENAIAILEVIIDAYRESWMNLDGSSGESGDLFYELDAAFAEALLSATITTDEQMQWQETLEIWEEDADDYGISNAFAKSQVALVQGWDDPELVAILQGEATDASDLEEPEAHDNYTLAQIRLNILERQERYAEYLNLAKATRHAQSYLTMLVSQGQIELAMSEAHQGLDNPTTAWSLAQALRNRGALEQALEIAELGLSLPGIHHKSNLALWTSELAEGLGKQAISLQARITAFKEMPTLTDYLKIQELEDPKEWPKLRKKLLAGLRKEHLFNTQPAVDIFLHEGLLKDAIKVVDQCSSYQSEPIRQVMEAAMLTRPDWVIVSACDRAESIMDEGKTKYYYHAVDWLRFVQRAYQQTEQLQKWQTYYAELRQKHARKRKLIDLMNSLDQR
jgi:uncharacterized Zn finger protein